MSKRKQSFFNKIYKPWGHFITLMSNKRYLIKILVIESMHQLSYQSHKLRNEHWLILWGKASIQIEKNFHDVGAKDYCYIPIGHKHRIKNTGHKKLVVIELQTGENFLEEDIIRYEDDYHRL